MKIRDTNTRPKRETSRRAVKTAYQRSVRLPVGRLGFTSAIAAGDFVRNQIVRREEFNAQHGPVKVLMRDGKLI